LLEETSDDGTAAAAFPLEVAPTARARDGIAPLLLRCPDATVSGTIELLDRRGDRRVSAGREPFTCEPPSEVVEIELTDAARDRLEDRGRLAAIVRVDAEGYGAPHAARITIRVSP
jgi:hypothetical protein